MQKVAYETSKSPFKNACFTIVSLICENIGDITKINTQFENGESKLYDVLSKLNKPDFEIRDYNFKVTRQIYSATLSVSDKKLVIVQYSVDSTETSYPYCIQREKGSVISQKWHYAFT